MNKQTLGAIAACIVIVFMGYLHLRLNMQYGMLKGQHEELQRRYHVDSAAWDAKRAQDSLAIQNCLHTIDSFSVVSGKQAYQIRVLKSQVSILQVNLKRCKRHYGKLSQYRYNTPTGGYSFTPDPPDWADNAPTANQSALIHQALYRPVSGSDIQGRSSYTGQVSVPQDSVVFRKRTFYMEEETYVPSRKTFEVGIGPSIGQALTSEGNLITYVGIGFNLNIVKFR